MTPGEFIARRRVSELKERSASQAHFIDLCRLLGELTPVEADPTGERYCFERGARKDIGGDGWADVWNRLVFGMFAEDTGLLPGNMFTRSWSTLAEARRLHEIVKIQRAGLAYERERGMMIDAVAARPGGQRLAQHASAI